MCAAIALTNMEIFERDGVLENVRSLEGHLEARLEELRALPIVGDTRGAGFFWAVELVKDEQSTRFDQAERDELLRGFLPRRLREAGLIARADDRGDSVLQIAPPLNSDAALLDEIVDRLGDVLTDAGGAHAARHDRGGCLMLVGLVTEIKPGERRCALTPAGARELTAAGHNVLVQAGAGDGSGFTDADYTQAGARLAPDAEPSGRGADLLLKVKEPIAARVRPPAGRAGAVHLPASRRRPGADRRARGVRDDRGRLRDDRGRRRRACRCWRR